MGWIARSIEEEPGLTNFEKHVNHSVIPELHKELEPVNSSWNSWKTGLGLAIGGNGQLFWNIRQSNHSGCCGCCGIDIDKGRRF